jgi:hypothetical protein
MKDLTRLDLFKLGKRFRVVQMCGDLFPFRKAWNLLYLVCEKTHSVLHSAEEILRWGSLINSSGEAAEGTYKINVTGSGVNLNHRDTDGGALLAHARRKEATRMLGSAIQGIRSNVW